MGVSGSRPCARRRAAETLYSRVARTASLTSGATRVARLSPPTLAASRIGRMPAPGRLGGQGTQLLPVEEAGAEHLVVGGGPALPGGLGQDGRRLLGDEAHLPGPFGQHRDRVAAGVPPHGHHPQGHDPAAAPPARLAQLGRGAAAGPGRPVHGRAHGVGHLQALGQDSPRRQGHVHEAAAVRARTGGRHRHQRQGPAAGILPGFVHHRQHRAGARGHQDPAGGHRGAHAPGLAGGLEALQLQVVARGVRPGDGLPGRAQPRHRDAHGRRVAGHGLQRTDGGGLHGGRPQDQEQDRKEGGGRRDGAAPRGVERHKTAHAGLPAGVHAGAIRGRLRNGGSPVSIDRLPAAVNGQRLPPGKKERRAASRPPHRANPQVSGTGCAPHPSWRRRSAPARPLQRARTPAATRRPTRGRPRSGGRRRCSR